MNRLIGGLLLGLLGLLAGISLGLARPEAMIQSSRPSASPIPTLSPSTSASPLATPTWPTVQVDRAQLMADLSVIEGVRFNDADRAKTRNYLTKRLKTLGWLVREQSFAQGVNLVATLPGATVPNAKPVWVVGAHYDTVRVAPGADDNGTGVAALLALAQGYAKTIAPIELVFFDQEENGLLGSLAYVDRLRLTGRLGASSATNPATNPATNSTTIRGAIILDMVGSACYEPGCQAYPQGLVETLPKSVGKLPDRGNFIAVVGDTEHPELLQAFGPSQLASPSIPGLFALPVPFKGILTPDVLRSDHSPFWLQNVGAVLVTDTANLRNPNYHRSTDRLDTVDPAFFAGVVQRVADAVGRLLKSP
jgi:Zn-dependent M28 family amino/carboxypeptidase